ncbi:MAG TPA: ribose 5-phosphate isomerase B [Phycisphaerae bacterium]|nr:ribose 5-phosphate isomerase B [Phycisphaerae bacterium]
MRIAICSDHRGFRAKETIKALLVREGHTVQDFGSNDRTSCDYPDTAIPASQSVAEGINDFGVMICGTGIGMSITANKVRGIRAALCHDELTAELARKHNDGNVLCLSGDLVGEELMKRVVDVWLNTRFEGGRHARRLAKIKQFEKADGAPESSQA